MAREDSIITYAIYTKLHGTITLQQFFIQFLPPAADNSVFLTCENFLLLFFLITAIILIFSRSFRVFFFILALKSIV